MTKKKEFIELVAECSRINGLDDLAAKIIGILYIESNELSLEEISNKTGYSLSAISTSIKPLERVGFVKRLKKPKSRKVFFYMEKDLFKVHMEIMKRNYEQGILGSKKVLPEIIKNYNPKNDKEKMELKIIKDYYDQLLIFEDMMKKMMEMFEKNV